MKKYKFIKRTKNLVLHLKLIVQQNRFRNQWPVELSAIFLPVGVALDSDGDSLLLKNQIQITFLPFLFVNLFHYIRFYNLVESQMN